LGLSAPRTGLTKKLSAVSRGFEVSSVALILVMRRLL
jgi:hypothetical protein